MMGSLGEGLMVGKKRDRGGLGKEQGWIIEGKGDKRGSHA